MKSEKDEVKRGQGVLAMKLEEIEALLDAATPGPWFAHATDDHDFANARYVSDREGAFIHDNKRSLTHDRRSDENIIAVTLWQRSPFIDERDGREDDNARLIAAAPTIIRELVERVRRAERIAMNIRSVQKSWGHDEDAYEQMVKDLEDVAKEST